MGGSVGKAINPTNIGRGLAAAASFGTSELLQKKPFGVINNPTGLGIFGKSNTNPSIAGPFSLDPNQLAADQSNIENLGNKQYADTLAGIDANAAAQQDYAGQTVNRMLPGIYEDLNSRHLLNSSALQTEIARQATSSAQDIASQVANAKLNALQGRQGFETGALQRGFSLEDFVNQANVAKTIGAQMAPQVGNGKGTAIQGLGTGAAVGAPFGPWGTGIGAGLGLLLGGGANGGRSGK